MENPIEMDDLRVPLFSETSIYNMYMSMFIHGVFFPLSCYFLFVGCNEKLGGCFKYFFMFTPIWGRFPF